MYVSGNRRFLYSFYIVMKYVVFLPNNLNRILNSLVVEHRGNPVSGVFKLTYTKFSSAILQLSSNER